MGTHKPVDLRELLLSTVQELEPNGRSVPNLTNTAVLEAVFIKLGRPYDENLHRDILSEWHELMRSGQFAWGLNLNNPDPPFFHVTSRGRQTLERLERDPGNPAGYLRHLSKLATLNPVASSYVAEALACYSAGQFKSAAVMLGGASESLVLELRDSAVKRLVRVKQTPPKELGSWKAKTVIDALHKVFDAQKARMPRDLREAVEAYWLAFGHQIRMIRNDAGHPASIEPVTEDAVHAAFLAFPELAGLQGKLVAWVRRNLR